MAETKPYVFDQAAWLKKLETLTKARDEQAGKPGKNPFLWWNAEVLPLQNKYTKGDRSKELFDALLAIKAEVPDLPAKTVNFPKK